MRCMIVLLVSNVQNVNLDTEWAQRKHFSSSNSITNFIHLITMALLIGTTTSTAFTTIENVAGTPSKVLPNYSSHGNVVVRVHASGLIAVTALNTNDGDGSWQHK